MGDWVGSWYLYCLPSSNYNTPQDYWYSGSKSTSKAEELPGSSTGLDQNFWLQGHDNGQKQYQAVLYNTKYNFRYYRQI